MTLYEAGDIVVVTFPGAVSTKRRPAVVLSSDIYHRTRPNVVVGLLTTHIPRPMAPSDVPLEDWASSGLRAMSVFRTYLYTVPQARVLKHVGRMSERDLRNVLACVRSALAIS